MILEEVDVVHPVDSDAINGLARMTRDVQALRSGIRTDPRADVDFDPAMRAAHELVRAAEALRIDLLAVCLDAGLHDRDGAVSAGAWAAQITGRQRHEGVRDADVATALADAPLTAEALADPALSIEKARIIVRAMAEIPPEVDPSDRERIEADLLAVARRHGARALRNAARRSLDSVTPPAGDLQEEETLADAEDSAQDHTWFRMSPADDAGMVDGEFRIPELEAEMLRAALEARTSPRHRHASDGGVLGDCDDVDAEVPEGEVREGEVREGEVREDEMREREVREGKGRDAAGRPAGAAAAEPFPHRLGKALCEILRHLPADSLHGGTTAQIVVLMDYASLVGQIDRAGTTAGGARVSPDTVRQLACDGALLPAVLGSTGTVLDLGRSQRLFSAAQRTAMAVRDGGCVFPGCDRPPAWCEAHHTEPWSHGGKTDIADGALVCGHHHRVVHRDGWEFRRRPDQRWELVPPATVDPRRRPRFNERWSHHAAAA